MQEQSGVALVTMLLLLLLLTALSLSMVMTYSSDILMNGYDRNFRASFYAADAGNTIIRQDISSQLYNQLPTSLYVGTYPLTSTIQTTIASTINTRYGTPVTISTGSSFPETFQIFPSNTSLTLYACEVWAYSDSSQAAQATNSPFTNTASSPTGSTTCPTATYAYKFLYTYHYSITTVGKAQGTGSTAITDSGNIIISATSNNHPNSFAQYGTFIDKQTICSAELIGGTITGEQFTNGNWTFGSDQTYNFTGHVGSSGKVGSTGAAGFMYSDGTCNQVDAASNTHSRSTISPTFQQGSNWDMQAVPLPTDENNQIAAVLTGAGTTNSGTSAATPTTAQLSAGLKDASGNASYTGSTSSGVFVPVNSSNTVTGGGLWVQGDATVVLSTTTVSGSAAQVYTITQGSTVTTVTVIPSNPLVVGAGSTVIKKGSNPATTYTGVPTQTDPVTGVVTNAMDLYVTGNITSLYGTVQNNTGITITAGNDMYITNNLTYATPVSDSSGNEINGTMTQALGLYTSGGSVYLQAPYNGANMEIDASIMTSKDNNGTCNYGNSCDGVLGVYGSNKIGTLTIVGGRVQSRAMIMPAGTIGTRNVLFDQRYNGTFAPPFFPKPSITTGNANNFATIQRTGWNLQTAY